MIIDGLVGLNPPTCSSRGCQPHTSSNMESMTSPASSNKAPYRGVASRPNSPVQWEGGGGYIRQYQKQRYSFQIFLSESRVYDKYQTSSIIRERHKSGEIQLKNWEITYINRETRRYGSKSGDYIHKSGDREIRFKIWRLPDYPGELTALSSTHCFLLF